MLYMQEIEALEERLCRYADLPLLTLPDLSLLSDAISVEILY